MADEAASSDAASEMTEDLAAPSFEFRFETAKLLIELDETTEDAVKVITNLILQIQVQIVSCMHLCIKSILGASFSLDRFLVSKELNDQKLF